MAINEEFKVQLAAVSAKVTGYIAKAENEEDKLILIDDWLKEMRYSIYEARRKKLETINTDEDKSSSWQDGMLIINSNSEILKNTGFQNHLQNSFNGTQKLRFIDFIEKSYQDTFQYALNKAIADRKNTRIEVLLKISLVNRIKCLIQFDIFSSNIENDRIILYYSFTDQFNLQTFDFQSFIFDNLPGIDLFLFDHEYKYILVGGKERDRPSNNALIGKQLFDIVDKKNQRKFFPFYNKALNGEYTEGEVRYKNDIYYLFAAPIKNQENKTVAGIIISQNVTKDKLLEESLIKNKEQAQKANKAKSIFLANVSHEIRTPLNSIIGFTEQLEKTNLTKPQADLVRVISSASDHLLYLVNEVVFLFKLGMNKVYVEKVSFSLQDLLSEIDNVCRKQAQEKNLVFMFDIADNIPVIVKNDPFRLRQILMNLLVNALKYTKKGYVKFSCKLVSENRKESLIRFEVSDSGIGINKKDLPFIFDMFEQGNQRTELIRGGAGLGLGICKRLVELLNGDIAVESTLRKGSTFTVQLPFGKATSLKIKDKQRKYDLSDELLSGKKILIADDDEHNLMLIEMMLKEWKTDFLLVKDGKEALTALEKKHFDLALLDINMPHKTGVQVVKKIRAKQENINYAIPIIALTANALKSDSAGYIKAGFNSSIIKPISETGLYNKLCNTLKIDPQKAKEDNTIPATENKSIQIDLFDTTALDNAAKGDSDFFNKMLDNFISNGNQFLDDITLEIEQNNWEAVGQKAHKAITAYKFFKLSSIAEGLMQLEDFALHDKNYAPIPSLFLSLKPAIIQALEQAKSAKKQSIKND
ncbi:MAG: ATP-binding protein [Bacteroidales bacterium]|jgi:signal transduction histidine kinase/DNA-binding response OmpR family regulator|nr:ATP-binding protein [Bacteroidales bacterium]